MIRSWWQKFDKLIIAVSLSALGLYFRFNKLAQRDLWLDEINQMNFTLDPFVPLWARASPGNDLTSFPGDYLLTYPFVRMFYMDKWGMAVAHILVTIVGFYVLYLLCKRYYKSTWAYAVAFVLMAFHLQLIWHSFELRPYAVLPTLALTSLYLMGTLFEGKANGNFWIGVFIGVVLLFHVYGILIVFVTMMFHAWQKAGRESWQVVWRDHARFFLCIGAVTILPWLWFTYGICSIKTTGLDFNTYQYIPNPMVDVKGFMRNVFGNLLGRKQLGFLLVAVPMALLVPHTQRKKIWMFGFLLIIFPVLLLFWAAVSKPYWFLQRQFVWVMPLFAFYVGLCWDSMIEFFSRRKPI